MENTYEISSMQKRINGFLVFSLIALCLTSTGWTMLASWPIFFALHVILMIRFNYIMRVLKKASVQFISVSKNSITIGIALFTVAFWFNVGDCGDNYGQPAFLFRVLFCKSELFGPWGLLGPWHLLDPWDTVLTLFCLLVLMAYFTYICASSEGFLKQRPENVPISIFTKVYRIIMGIIILIPVWGSAYYFYNTYQSKQRMREWDQSEQEEQLKQMKKQSYSSDKPTEYGTGR